MALGSLKSAKIVSNNHSPAETRLDTRGDTNVRGSLSAMHHTWFTLQDQWTSDQEQGRYSLGLLNGKGV